MVGPSPAASTTVINITSAAGHYVIQNLSSYSISKLAITQFTAFLNAELPVWRELRDISVPLLSVAVLSRVMAT
jgi:short-subunit dehydrogenase